MIDGIIERKKCILSDNINLRHLYTFKKFPIYCGCVTDDYSKDLFCDMSWDESVNTGIVQLKHLILQLSNRNLLLMVLNLFFRQ